MFLGEKGPQSMILLSENDCELVPPFTAACMSDIKEALTATYLLSAQLFCSTGLTLRCVSACVKRRGHARYQRTG